MNFYSASLKLHKKETFQDLKDHDKKCFISEQQEDLIFPSVNEILGINSSNYICKHCGHVATMMLRQTRSADEGASSFLVCKSDSCGKSYQIN
jgi:DNA-directed RNA polymerase subunit M/transcription elongation factor TFIIS